jgi:hypothetical protein
MRTLRHTALRFENESRLADTGFTRNKRCPTAVFGNHLSPEFEDLGHFVAAADKFRQLSSFGEAVLYNSLFFGLPDVYLLGKTF